MVSYDVGRLDESVDELEAAGGGVDELRYPCWQRARVVYSRNFLPREGNKGVVEYERRQKVRVLKVRRSRQRAAR